MAEAPLEKRLMTLAMQMNNHAMEKNMASLSDYATTLADFAHQLENEYVRVTGDTQVPTTAQGIALARFLRPTFNSGAPGDRHARVSRGGAGLGDDYIHVVLPDGYEGGIDRDGRTST